jgi:hypothetical protein
LLSLSRARAPSLSIHLIRSLGLLETAHLIGLLPNLRTMRRANLVTV